MLAQMQLEQHRAMEDAITRALAMHQARQAAMPAVLPVDASGGKRPCRRRHANAKDKRWFTPSPPRKRT